MLKILKSVHIRDTLRDWPAPHSSYLVGICGHSMFSLYVLSENCDYGTLWERMIRDILVIGMRDEKLSEKIQLTLDLILKKTIDSGIQSEAVKKQQVELRQDPSESGSPVANADAVQACLRAKNKENSAQERRGAKPQSGRGYSTRPPRSEPRCGRYCYSPVHPRFRCPASNAECLKYKQIGLL